MVSRFVVASVLASVLMVAGCDQLFGIGFTDPPDAALHDANDGAIDAPPSPGGMCSQMSLLADDFSDGNLQRLWPTLVGDTLPLETDGVVTLVMSAQALLPSTSMAARYYDLRGSQIDVKVTDTGVGDGTYALELDAEDHKSSIQIIRSSTMLRFTTSHNGSSSQVGMLTLSTGEEPYWRISNTNDITTWATSADGITYTDRAGSVPGSLPWVTFMSPKIIANRGTTDYAVTVSKVNGGTPNGSACAASQLHDDFSNQTLDQQWARSEADSFGLLAPGGGQLEMEVASSNSNVILEPSTIYDLRGGAFAVEIPQVIDINNTGLSMTLTIASLDGSTTASIAEAAGTLTLTTNSTSFISAYDASADLWWRIREMGSTLYVEVSANGTTYDSPAMVPNVTGLDQVDVSLGVTGSTFRSETALADNFNVPPP